MSDTKKSNIYPLIVEHDKRNKLWPEDRIARLVAILDSQPDSVTILNRQLCIVDINPSGLKMIGAKKLAEVLGKNPIDFVDEIYHELYREAIADTLKGETTDIEFNIVGLDGKKRRFNQRSAPIFNRNDPNEVVEMVMVTRDITEQYHGHMELVEAKVEAEESARVKSSFLATMSHELRTPLNAILGFSQLMKNHSFGPLGHTKYEEYISDINNSGQHLLALINDVLYISEIEAKKGIIIKENINLRDIIVDCVNTVAVIAGQKNVDIGINIEDRLPKINADPRSVKQILINLFSNAIKFSHQEGSIILKARSDNESVTISVKDNGIGISEASQEEITQPFYRGQENAQIASPGTGLGLSIVKSLIDAHDGKLKIESKENLGTIVSFTLPIS